MQIARLTLLLLLATPLPGRAESLEDAWKIALAGNPALAASQSQQEAAHARQAAADALDWPSLNLSATAFQLSSPPGAALDTSALAARVAHTPFAALVPNEVDMRLADRNIHVANLALTYPLFTSGRITAMQHAATAGVALADANETTQRQTLKLNVAEQYINVLRAQMALDVAQQYRESLAAHQADVLAMEKQGLAAPVERLTATVAVAEADRKVIDARQGLALAQSAYNRLLARPLDTPTELAPIAALHLPDAEAELSARAHAHRPELLALDAGKTALDAQARAIRGQDGPQVALQAMQVQWHGLQTVENHTSTVGVTLSWSLFDAGSNRKQAAALSAEARAAALQHADALSLIQLDVRHALLDTQAARARLSVAISADDAASEALRLMRSRYRNGLATQTEALAAETRLADARRAHRDADLDIQLAELRLARAIGEL